jgi:predicted dehydrogenase
VQVEIRRPKIGLIGGGMMAQVGHLPFYLDDDRCEVVLVAEERPSLQAALAQRLGSDRIARERHEVLRRADIDAVVLCAPRTATGPLTLEVLDSGKHVLVEKPMAHTIDQARRLVEAAASRQRIYAVAFMKRYDPGVQAAKILLDEVLASGRLGKLLFARFYNYSRAYAMQPPSHQRPKESRVARYPVWTTVPDWLEPRWQSSYEWFLNVASHDVNLLTYFFPKNVAATSARCLADGSVTSLLSWGEVPITLEIAKTEAGRWLEGTEFVFERGRIALTVPSPMAVDRAGEIVLDDLAAGVEERRVVAEPRWSFARQASAFIDSLTTGRPMLTSGEDALTDMRLIDSIWRHAVE